MPHNCLGGSPGSRCHSPPPPPRLLGHPFFRFSSCRSKAAFFLHHHCRQLVAAPLFLLLQAPLLGFYARGCRPFLCPFPSAPTCSLRARNNSRREPEGRKEENRLGRLRRFLPSISLDSTLSLYLFQAACFFGGGGGGTCPYGRALFFHARTHTPTPVTSGTSCRVALLGQRKRSTPSPTPTPSWTDLRRLRALAGTAKCP